MSQLVFKVVGYLSSTVSDPLERETLASMQINAGPQRIALTEVEDILAHTVRTHINVPTYEVARWLLANWWRLRWEPQSKGSPSHDWMLRHSMAELGGGYAWPPLVLSSDGEFIQIRVESEDKADVSAIRYLRDLTIHVPASDFEEAVERFVDEVEARISALVPGCRELSDLRQELRDERSDPELAAASKLQALAGIDPGEVSADWLRDAKDLEARIGSVATEEILAVSPAFRGGLADAFSAIWAMRDSEAHVQLGWASSLSRFAQGPDLPWVRGAKLAHEVRRHLGVPSGPISRATPWNKLWASRCLSRSRRGPCGRWQAAIERSTRWPNSRLGNQTPRGRSAFLSRTRDRCCMCVSIGCTRARRVRCPYSFPEARALIRPGVSVPLERARPFH